MRLSFSARVKLGYADGADSPFASIQASRSRALNMQRFKNIFPSDLHSAFVFLMFLKAAFVLHEEDETCLFLEITARDTSCLGFCQHNNAR